MGICSLGDKWTLRRSISKSLLCIRRCISFFFCICNVSKYYFLFVWKANKVEVGEYDVFMNDFHLCTLESAGSGLVSMSVVQGPLSWYIWISKTFTGDILIRYHLVCLLLPVWHPAGLDGFVVCIDPTYSRDSLTNIRIQVFITRSSLLGRKPHIPYFFQNIINTNTILKLYCSMVVLGKNS